MPAECKGAGHNPVPGTIEYKHTGPAITPDRGRCAWCRKSVALTMFGTLANHRPQTMRDVIDAYERGYQEGSQ
jgi:hypothetical protein